MYKVSRTEYNAVLVAYFRKFLKVKDEKLIIDLRLYREEFDGNVDEEEFFKEIKEILNSSDEYPEETLFM